MWPRTRRADRAENTYWHVYDLQHSLRVYRQAAPHPEAGPDDPSPLQRVACNMDQLADLLVRMHPRPALPPVTLLVLF